MRTLYISQLLYFLSYLIRLIDENEDTEWTEKCGMRGE